MPTDFYFYLLLGAAAGGLINGLAGFGTGCADWSLRRESIGYFRSYLVLNSLYYLSDENILNLDLATEAVTAPYKGRGDSEGLGPIQVLIVKYSNPARAKKALHRFHEAYLPEHPKDPNLSKTTRFTDFFKDEDRWLGYMLSGDLVAMVFECPDEQTARALIHQLPLDESS